MVDLIFNFSKLIIGIICLIVGLKMAITGEWGFRFTKTEDWSAKNPKRRRKKVKGQQIVVYGAILITVGGYLLLSLLQPMFEQNSMLLLP